MKPFLLGATLVCLACSAQARDGLDFMDAKAIAKAQASASGQPPFTSSRRDPMPELLLREEQQRRGPQAACNNTGADVCYDLAAGRIVYRPARRYMPGIDGLTAESISLRHDRIILKYSFR
jgi:hypothetical protein